MCAHFECKLQYAFNIYIFESGREKKSLVFICMNECVGELSKSNIK